MNKLLELIGAITIGILVGYGFAALIDRIFHITN